MIPTLTISYEASAAIDGGLIVAFSDAANTRQVAPAAASTAPIIGVADPMGADAGGMCDVHVYGFVGVKLGAAVSAGDPLTADANGAAVLATPAMGATTRIIGFADSAGAVDEIIDVFLAPGFIHA